MTQLTKTVRLDPAVIDILRGMTWENGGCLGKIDRQLSRPDYEAVNTVLTAMGGKWNRKAGGHVFAADPRPRVEGLLDSGSMTVVKDGFFETPEWLAERMAVELDLFDGALVLEPSAGGGRLVRAVLGEYSQVSLEVCELNEHRYQALEASGCTMVGRDFMAYCPGPRYHRAIMNPPFENRQDIDHVSHAYDLLLPGGRLIAIMSEGTFFREDKKSRTFLSSFGRDIDIQALPADTFRESGTGVRARMITIDK